MSTVTTPTTIAGPVPVYLNLGEAAELASVDVQTMRKWLKAKKIGGFQGAERGTWKIDRDKLLEVLGSG